MLTRIPMNITIAPRLLLKSAPGRPLARSLGVAGNSVKLTELYPNEHIGSATAAVAPARWYTANFGASPGSLGEMWDLAYETSRKEGVYVEPDVGRKWEYENRVSGGLGAAPGELCAYDPESSDFPQGNGFAWHLDLSQLRQARTMVQDSKSRVRIGILDTGFDPTHQARPEHLLLNLQRNFVDDGQSKNDASDPYSRGPFKNPGHGTGTIGLLAGQVLQNMAQREQNGDFLGGAPRAEVLPVRISPGVVLLFTSAFAQGLDYLIAPGGDPAERVDVLSMSMGGAPSKAWADVVNRAYEAGIVMVTAAGNNYVLTPQSIVYPARFNRVIAACGVMADGRPYIRQNVKLKQMAGNYGPDSKMDTALAAYTPNMPWAEINCAAIVDMDGQGTSSATPQIAAAAALYLQKFKEAMNGFEPYEKVEAVRKALFDSAYKDSNDSHKYFGQGVLRAADALGVAPQKGLSITQADSASFGFWKVLFGQGITAGMPDHQREMLGIEVAQLFQVDSNVALSMEDPDAAKEPTPELFAAILGSPYASQTLKQSLAGFRKSAAGPGADLGRPSPPARPHNQFLPSPVPSVRRLRVYAIDPSFSTRATTAAINDITIPIRWETDLRLGPSGEYVEVIDHDPASGCFYQPVDLNEPHLLANDGLPRDPADPRFHQQMVYAVSMRTIENFERGLGRKVLWSYAADLQSADDSLYVRQLRIYPHALREENAYYDPDKKALLFGYFPASGAAPAELYPDGIVFTCLSHDIVAHETTHAVLDGMHRNLSAEGSVDDLAFHEAFADLVALFQHFSLPDVLRFEISRTRGSFDVPSLLAEIGQEFGAGIGLHRALRSAIGREPDPNLISSIEEPHDRGSILVAAVFGAFVDIYKRRSSDLLRLASDGTGILTPGEIPADLVGRLSEEARKAAEHVLTICIRALDFCPPIDLTFGDYLRALITADYDVVKDDPFQYRIAFTESFRRWGIYPQSLRSLTPESLRWRGLQFDESAQLLRNPLSILREYADKNRHLSQLEKYDSSHRFPAGANVREKIFIFARAWRIRLHNALQTAIQNASDSDRAKLAVDLGLDFTTGYERFELHALRVSEKIGPDGDITCRIIVQILQSRREMVDGNEVLFKGGSTLIIDEDDLTVQYSVLKSIASQDRLQRLERSFAASATLRRTYFGGSALNGTGHRFAILHSSEEI